MSRQNKVNPGMYTQRGRLSQDDAARELRKQSVIGSPHTWQPVSTKTQPRLAPAGDAARETDTSADNEVEAAMPKTARTGKSYEKSEAPLKGRPTSKRTAGNAKTVKAKTGKALPTARKRTTKPTRKAVRARKVGGGGVAPRRTAKRRNS
jgi:hypothetical protein